MEDGEIWPLEVTIAPGESSGTVTAENLPRGTYVLTEQDNEVYRIRSLEIGPDTNCYAALEDKSAVFHMGNDPEDKNVIGKLPGDYYTSYTGTPNGVYGEAIVVNEKTVYYGELPVTKLWSGADTTGDDKTVFVVLYQNTDSGEQLVLDYNGNARLLKLNAQNRFKGTFKVPLPEKGSKVEEQGYFVREVSGIGSTADDRQTAVLENDGTTILYYQSVVGEEGLITYSNRQYIVTYEIDETTGAVTVTNHATVSLPATGGAGTNMYTFSGLAIVLIVTLIYGYIHFYRRKKGGGT
jgi:LPXTG-motif cell wall-anchored protein